MWRSRQKLTEEPTVAPLLGLLTFTPAIAGMANAHRHTNAVQLPEPHSDFSSRFFLLMVRECAAELKGF